MHSYMHIIIHIIIIIIISSSSSSGGGGYSRQTHVHVYIDLFLLKFLNELERVGLRYLRCLKEEVTADVLVQKKNISNFEKKRSIS